LHLKWEENRGETGARSGEAETGEAGMMQDDILKGSVYRGLVHAKITWEAHRSR